MSTNDDDGAEIRAYPDGPLLVRGNFQLLDEAGDQIPSERGTIALCRCGHSAIAPLCDGTHTVLARSQPRAEQPERSGVQAGEQ
jgi:CDGSH-type Zn-finger protein